MMTSVGVVVRSRSGSSLSRSWEKRTAVFNSSSKVEGTLASEETPGELELMKAKMWGFRGLDY